MRITCTFAVIAMATFFLAVFAPASRMMLG